jgi:DNA repair protein RecN (Recombination protein N)
MLQKLHIHNYAIIDEIEIDFSNQLNIITGETGAGKSILMGALSLILGERADISVLQQKEKKCSIEGLFEIKNNTAAKNFLQENDLDVEEELMIRREIAATGKSRAFINDTPVNLTQLKNLSAVLVDLHQQFDTLELGDNNFQREVVDALADNNAVVQQYYKIYLDYIQTKKEVEALQLQQHTANKELDYNKFLYDELQEAGFTENELEELEAELKVLNNAEHIKEQVSAVYFELKESEQPIVQQLKVLVNKLSALPGFNTALPDCIQRLQSTQVELQDIAGELENISDAVQHNPERISIINDKISTGYKLLKKHHVSTTNELLEIKHALQQKLDTVLNINDEIAAKEKTAAALLESSKKLAETISGNRKKTVQPFAQKVNALLAQVGMPNARFMVEVVNTDMLQPTGTDKIEFLFDGNKSNHFEPLRKVASGGELSRLMLCIKSLVAKKLQLPTLIFDEIDTGISGEAAKQVGVIMKELSKTHQLIAITHQPQIAAKANAHYFVYKSIHKDKIVTAVRLLNNDERITTIAQMLSGEKPTAAALQNAREMLGN